MNKYIKEFFLIVIICVIGILCLACEKEYQKELRTTTTQESSTQGTTTQETTTQEATIQESFYGNWIIEKYIPTNTPSQYYKSDIDEFIGQKLVFSAERATCGEDTCEQPYYKKQTISYEDMIIRYKVNYETIGIDSDTPIQMVEIFEGKYNWDSIGSSFFVKDENTLIIRGGGIFLETKRVE